MGPPPPPPTTIPLTLAPYDAVAILVTAAAAFAYVNHRVLKLHPTVGIVVQALAAAAAWRAAAAVWPAAARAAAGLRAGVDLNAALFHWMLGPLLFAGALRVDLHHLRTHRATVAVLSVLGTALSAAVVAGAAYAVLRLAGVPAPLPWCAVFGAVVSPTDPVAVLGFLKAAAAPPDIEAVIAGESLFNDGVGVVLFTVLLGVAGGTHAATAGGVAWDFARQAVGGVAVGLAAAALVYHLLKGVDDYPVEVLLTVALALGGYALADAVGASGPLAAVVAGLLIGSHGRTFAVSDLTRQHLDDFWELVEEGLNAVLFLIVGLVALQATAGWRLLAAQAAAVAVALAARWVSVVVSTTAVSFNRAPARRLGPHTVAVLTWGGLRGGLAVAMALSLPTGRERDLIVPATYAVVVFSVVVQGGTLPRLFRRWLGPAAAESSNDPGPPPPNGGPAREVG